MQRALGNFINKQDLKLFYTHAPCLSPSTTHSKSHPKETTENTHILFAGFLSLCGRRILATQEEQANPKRPRDGADAASVCFDLGDDLGDLDHGEACPGRVQQPEGGRQGGHHLRRAVPHAREGHARQELRQDQEGEGHPTSGGHAPRRGPYQQGRKAASGAAGGHAHPGHVQLRHVRPGAVHGLYQGPALHHRPGGLQVRR